ncbi:MAG TPA: signal peptidase II [Candidatus Brachybacterium merdigallinarum]|nr:signal peptidase II [Candidatus Brachybacterium merdigallinarum]
MSPAPTTPASAGPASGSGARRRLPLPAVLVTIAVIAVLLLVADQATKNWAVANLPELEPQPFLGEFLQLTLLYNSGAAWGLGSGITPVVTVLQILISIGVIVFAVAAVRSPWYAAALGLILGGALGNVHDRLLREPGPFRGEVVDFLELPNWPVFNIADMAVVGGAILVVLLSVIGLPSDPAQVEAEKSEDAERPEAAQTPENGEEPADPEAEEAQS